MYDTLIQCEDLNNHIGDEGWLIFDCRFNLADPAKGERLYAESHIPGSIYAHLDERLSSPITPHSGRHPMPDPASFNAWLSACGVTAQTQIVVYDDTFGAMATRLWWLMKCLGHRKVALLDGGWQAWSNGQYALDSQAPRLRPSNFNLKMNGSFLFDTEKVMANLKTNEYLIIDVRAKERFLGENEPIDPVAGHIPGAINMPLTENLDDSGFYKPVDVLREMYSPVCDQWSELKQVYMCGSGVTACHSVLAMTIAGFAMPKLYTGSWSEWIRDPARPVATGPD